MFTYLFGKKPYDFDIKVPEQKKFDELPVNTFVKFYENPVDWYFDNILGIKYEEIDETLPENELFGLDSLQEWAVKQSLLKLGEGEIDAFLEKEAKEGHLPLKNLGRVTVEDLQIEISELRARFQELTRNRNSENILIDLEVDGIRLKGTIDGIYDKLYITYAFSDKPKYKVRAYLNSLMLYAENKIESVEFVRLEKSKDKRKPASLISETIPFIDREQARKNLSELLVYFNKGNEVPLKFTPGAADKVLNDEIVENIFLEEAEGISYASLPPDYCVKTLYDEDYFHEFEIENFNKKDFDIAVYEEERFKEIKSIAGLLNLKSALL
jgi:exodeoxyribonuclease V gamma subunit